ncbi:hypothetical protein [Actinoplanes couchii]|uniref:hypothetical protein n=1 Tax=Actinoplanes couchii TaxID=403638 RepID=UPI001940600B|nr:hypothetical protein [Actinoplanes couchii]MDR6321708.1 hypothetical protein [Actinoplanes couchii]
MGPQPDHIELDGVEATRTGPAWQPRVENRPTVEISTGRPTIELHMVGRPPAARPKRPVNRTMALVLAGLLAAGTVAWFARGSSPDEPAGVSANPSAPILVEPDQPDQPDPNPPVAIEPQPSAPEAPQEATFELANGVTELNVTIGDTGTEAWFTATAPNGAAVKPRAEFGDDGVKLFVDKVADEGSARVDVLLSPGVAWSVRMRGGVKTGTFDLTGGRVDRIDLLGGAAAIDIALPEQDAVVPVQMSGGVNDWRIRTADQIPVRATLRNGAGTVVLYGDRTQGVNRGSVLTATDGNGGLDVIADEGVGTLTVSAA